MLNLLNVDNPNLVDGGLKLLNSTYKGKIVGEFEEV